MTYVRLLQIILILELPLLAVILLIAAQHAGRLSHGLLALATLSAFAFIVASAASVEHLLSRSGRKSRDDIHP